MQGHVGKLLPQRRYQHGGGTESQEAHYVLYRKRVNSHVGEISCQIYVILKTLLALFGVRCVPRVREVTLHKPTSATDGINTELQVNGIDDIIEDAEYVYIGFRSLFEELMNYAIGIVGLSRGVCTTQ